MKFFVGLNVWALPLAAISSFIFGGVWYGLLSRPWMAAANISEEEFKAGGPSPKPFIITFIAQLFMAWMLAGLILHMAKAGIAASYQSGMISAFFIWAGFVLTTLVVNHQFQMKRPMLTLIDGGHWLGVLLIQGAVLGAFAIQ